MRTTGGKPWSPREVADLAKLWEALADVPHARRLERVAAALGRTLNSVRYRLERDRLDAQSVSGREVPAAPWARMGRPFYPKAGGDT